MKVKPEILAPAGSMESLKGAVSAGCDAVYIGGTRFGARAYADNPDTDMMIQALKYCHLHGVKLYLTVNTLLKETELEQELYEYILPYYEAGLDAAIVQDLGVMRALHRWFPDLDLHASTQMNLVTGTGAERLRPYGVTRIVPARELSLQELEQMRLDTDLELEVFVHGALCYCYSGRCLFSSMQGGRSGNRGRCTQPCRMLYHGQGQSGYYLSLKELCNLAYLPQLIRAGIDSFKIEGRMKRPEYTAQVTAIYRHYVDLYCNLGEDGFCRWQETHQGQWQEDLGKLAELYNREGFTDGYLTGRYGMPSSRQSDSGTMLSIRRPRHGGVRIGEVVSVDAYYAEYRLEREIAAQDVVEFRDRSGQTIYEYTVGNGGSQGQTIRTRYQKGCRIRVGDGVYRTRHQQLLDVIRQEYLASEETLLITGIITAKPGEECTLTVSRLGHTVSVHGDIVQPASKQPATEESVRRAVCQTGDSAFAFAELEVCLEGSVFLPVGMLKRMRREALDRLEQKLLADFGRDVPDRMDALTQKQSDSLTGEGYACDRKDGKAQAECVTETVSAAVMSFDQLEPVLQAREVSEVILRMDQMTEKQLERGAELIQNAGRRCVLGLPAIWRKSTWEDQEERFSQGTGIFRHLKPDGYLIQNLESFAFLTDVVGVPTERIRTDAALYVMNQETLRWWEEQGVMQHTAPWELTGREWQRLGNQNCWQIIIYGHIPLMVSAQCVVRNMDHCMRAEQKRSRLFHFEGERKRQYTAVNYCQYCYNIIYQGMPFSIVEEIPRLRQAGFAHQRYEFSIENAEQIRGILSGEVAGETESGHYQLEVF